MFIRHKALGNGQLAFSQWRTADMKDFRQLKVWSKAHSLTLGAYRCTANFPRHELFGLTSQIRRCSASIPANIAEGCGRSGNGEFHRFLQIAAGSASELEYHFLLSRDLGLLNEDDYVEISTTPSQVRKMLAALILKVGSDRKAASYNS
jgi:four helix bundle protein